ncbi:MAG: protein kinase [Deltaproteobacteria bacterium]|nr:protein kinase [Deltaproteobacteria bacterium]
MAAPRLYRLIDRVAESDAGETWRGVATGAGDPEPATLKILSPRVVFPEIVAALGARVESAGKLKHPSLVVPWELGVAGGRTVLASRHVLGHDLDIVFQRLRSREVKLTVSRAVHLVAEAANAVSALHLAGQLHGSLGPSDLFVGFDGTVKVSCAGLRPALEQHARTRQMATRGRRAYRAPELSRNSVPDALADVYALGAIVYELTTGKSLEEAGPRGTSTRSDSLTPPSRIDRRVPMKLDAVVMKALETAKSRRYHDAAELREALWGYLDEMGEVITPADLAAFAASVLPNEVVQKDFDPDEAAQGTPPIPGTFSLSPLATGEGVAPDLASTAEIAVFSAPPDPETLGEAAAAPPSFEETGSESTQRLEAAQLASTGHRTDPAGNGMLASAPDLSDAEAQAAPDSLAPPPGMLSEAPPAEEEGELRGDIFSRTVEMQVVADAPPPSGAAAPGTEAEGLAPDFGVPPEHGGPDPGDAPAPATGPDPAPAAGDPAVYGAGVEPADSRQRTEYQAPPVAPRRRMWPWLVVAGVAPILVAVGFILGRQDPEPTQAELAALEAGLTALEQGQTPAPAEASPPPADPDPAPPEEASAPEPVPVVKGAERSAPREPDPPPAETRPAKTKAPVAKRGRLTVISSHRARVYVDGKDTGRFTPLKGYRLSAGKHVVTLIQPSTGITQKRRITVRPGGRVNLKVRFK